MPGDVRQIVESVLLAYATLFPIVNPVGGAPVFLAMTADCTPELRATLAKRIAINAFVLMLASVFVGTYVLDFFGLSLPIVQVAGGIVVCSAGWALLKADGDDRGAPSTPPAAAEIASRAFYPLTLPLTVGPGTITVAITIGANHPTTMRALVDHSVGQIVGVLVVAATIFVCYRYADRLLVRLGAAGTSVVVRLSAFILFCIGVQIAWNGTRALLGSVGLIYGR
ncbi:MAG: MarC family protein [Betaproteobacteria bacterium]